MGSGSLRDQQVIVENVEMLMGKEPIEKEMLNRDYKK